MTTPIELTSQVGYCPAADVYCTYTEYYGDGTVYGWRHIYIGDQVVRGAGKVKAELVAAGAVAEEAMCPAVPTDIVIVPAEVPAEPVVVPEAPAEPEVPAPAAAPAAPQMPYTVKLIHADFTVEYKNVRSVEVADATGKLTFSVA